MTSVMGTDKISWKCAEHACSVVQSREHSIGTFRNNVHYSASDEWNLTLALWLVVTYDVISSGR